MPSLPLTSLEREKIANILAAALAKDWPRFEALSDLPFINPASMKEQFDDTVKLISDDLSRWEDNAFVEKLSGGDRLIHVGLPHKAANGPDINLFVRSTKAGIRIMVFYKRYQFD
ncbi:hypothetical protein ABMA32_14675 [Mesorhizobium sp. VNQ89]|uniref:hypothetical protein n=1 Tax=Mesorhizobium quangtriensis TaxID=3157709 RepID=UPI0032B799A6